MPRSEWIDEMLSRELSLMRDRGEGQHLEFMGSYPKNGHELSKEIAAFASSNPRGPSSSALPMTAAL